MKLIGIITVMLAIGLVFAILGSVVNDFETQYPEVEVNSSWSDKYDYQETISDDASTLQIMLEKMGDEETGWILKSLIGVAAIPVAFVTAIGIVLSSMGIGITIFTEIAAEIGIPPFVVKFGVTLLIVLVVWSILAWWRRWRE